MSLSAPFITRPIATALLMLAIVVLGAISYTQLPVAALPNIDSPTIQVTAQLPGADPNTVASSVATQLEAEAFEGSQLSTVTWALARLECKPVRLLGAPRACTWTQTHSPRVRLYSGCGLRQQSPFYLLP